MSSVGLTASWHPCKQRPWPQTGTLWILQKHQHSWSVVPRVQTDHIHPCCQCFGVKFVNKADVDHLISSIKQAYRLTKDWTGNLYCGITLEWDYMNRTVDISMLGYIKKKLQEYKHVKAKKLQTCPYSPEPT
jgi:hypothetical protein